MEIALARKVAPAIADGPMSLLQTRRLASRSVLAGLVFAAMSGWCLACGVKRYTKRWTLPQEDVEAISMDSPDCVSVSEKFVDPVAEYLLRFTERYLLRFTGAKDPELKSALKAVEDAGSEMAIAGPEMVKACGGGEGKPVLIYKLFLLQAFNAFMQVLPVIDVHLTNTAEKAKEIPAGTLPPEIEEMFEQIRAAKTNERTLDTCKEVSKTIYDKTLQAVEGASAGGMDLKKMDLEHMQEALAEQAKLGQMAYAKCDPSDHAQLEVFGDYAVKSLIASFKNMPPRMEEQLKEEIKKNVPIMLKTLGV